MYVWWHMTSKMVAHFVLLDMLDMGELVAVGAELLARSNGTNKHTPHTANNRQATHDTTKRYQNTCVFPEPKEKRMPAIKLPTKFNLLQKENNPNRRPRVDGFDNNVTAQPMPTHSKAAPPPQVTLPRINTYSEFKAKARTNGKYPIAPSIKANVMPSRLTMQGATRFAKQKQVYRMMTPNTPKLPNITTA